MSTRVQIPMKPAAAAVAPALFTPAPFGTLQRKCACGGSAGAGSGSGQSGGDCEDCKKKKMTLQRRAIESTGTAIANDVMHAPGQPLDSGTRAFLDQRSGHDFRKVRVNAVSAESVRTAGARSYTPMGRALPGRVEPVGDAHCDIDQGKMVWSVDASKIPLCMADCAMAHEKAHVEFGKADCAKLSAASKAATDALNKAKQSPSDASLKDAQQKADDFKKAKDEHDKWLQDTCREDERQAYQAGIDACKKDGVVKSCGDLRETDRYNQGMKDWQTFRDNPPNCAAATPTPQQPQKTPGAKLSASQPRTLSQMISQSSRCACGAPKSGGDECAACRAKKESSSADFGVIHRAAVDQITGAEAPAIVHEVLNSPGQMLDAGARAFFEPRFGHDFGGVRIHSDHQAAESARAVNAHAYAVGRDIVFGAGQYSPHTSHGRELLAHELAHTLQHGAGAVEGGAPGRLVLGDPATPAEREAESTAKSVLAGGPTTITPDAAGQPALRRQGGTPPPAPTTPPVQQPPAGGAPATPGQTGGGAGGGGTGTCTPQGLDRAAFLATAGATQNDFGLTTLDTTAVTYPTVTTNPAKPSGVTVAQTTAALPNIPSVYTKLGVFTEGDMNVVGGGGQGSCSPGKYPLKWIISAAGAQKIAEGEQEHCNDFQYAFDNSLKQYADAVNALASSGKVFPDAKAVDTALTTTTGVAPANWRTVFVCLSKKTLLRDPKNVGANSWHTPHVVRSAPTYPDCKEATARIEGGALPQVGQHPSSEIIKGCGEKQAPAAKAGNK